jgi:hypothetical protein
MTTSKARLEERLEGADLLSTRLRIIQADIELAISYAGRSGHTSLIGEATRLRKGARELNLNTKDVGNRLRLRIQQMEASENGSR